MSRHLFDPLAALESMHVDVALDAQGNPRLAFTWRHSHQTVAEAKRITKTYSKLLRVQLAAGRKSVMWLIAHGRIRLEAGRYVAVERGAPRLPE